MARHVDNGGLGLAPAVPANYDDLAQRLQVRVDWLAPAGLGGALEVGTYAIKGTPAPVPASQRNPLDLALAYADWALPRQEPGELTLRVGRQELVFGSSRMTSARDGANLRQAFDGFRVGVRPIAWPDWRVDAFVARPVLARDGSFDDTSQNARPFNGVYATHTEWASSGAAKGLDVYLLSHGRSGPPATSVGESIQRQTLGLRSFGRQDGWDWDIEAAAQIGQAPSARVRAFTWANDVGYTSSELPGSPRWGLKVDLSSGDSRPGQGRITTFDVPFPKLPYLSEVGTTSPSNILDIHPSVTLTPAAGWRLSAECAWIWKHRRADAYYLPGGSPVHATFRQSRRLGYQPQVVALWQSGDTTVRTALARHVVGEGLRVAKAKDSSLALVSVSFRFQ